jgi:Mrp family chromosome partitioning ATPase
MKEFISSLKEQYDLIIIDSPPALAVHDPVVLGTLVDGIIYVVESSKISAAMINHVTDLFNKANVNIIGVIMNKVKSPGMGHYQGYYHSYYDSYNHRE